jgi:predicted porin
LEGKASYSFSGEAVSGKIWTSGASYDVQTASLGNHTITVGDIGANLNAGNLGLTGYWYRGEGAGTTLLGLSGIDAAGNKRDSDGGYLQGTYVLPTKTKLGLAYGVSNLDRAADEDAGLLVRKSNRITVGAYHPLTKHLNLVAEYNDIKSKAHDSEIADQEARSMSLGAILFF